MNAYYKNINEMTDRELKQLAQLCFEHATGTKVAQYNVHLLESSDSLWFRVGVLFFLVVDYFEIDSPRRHSTRAFYTSNDRKEAVYQF
jgi:hypothetical protein